MAGSLREEEGKDPNAELPAGYGDGPDEPLPEVTRKESVDVRGDKPNGSRHREEEEGDPSVRRQSRGHDDDRDRRARRYSRDDRDRRDHRSRSRSRERRRGDQGYRRSISPRDRKRSRRSRSRSPDTFRKRRETYWDVKESPYGVPLPPAGMSAMSGHAEGQGNAVPAPNPAAAAQAVAAAIAPNAVVPPASVAQQMQAGELAATMAQPTYQATRHARRLYVGNLPADSTDADVSEFFNKSMTVAGGVESPGNPVLSVYLNLDKRFAFIELRTMAEAAAALQMDGVLFRGMSLRMRRPNDYNPIAFPPVEPPASFNPSLLGIVSTQVPDGPNKVFIGGIPYHLTEDQIKELLQAYGPLGAFNLIKDANTGLSKGYAFFEYQDPSIIDVACQGLNGMQINDKTLTVRRANQQGGSSQKTAQMGVGGVGQIQMPTRVLELDNMLTEEDLQNEEEYDDICEDIKEECSKYGNLEEVLIPRKGPEDAPEAKGVGKVYLKYSKPEETSRAYASMMGRKFGGRPVVAKYLDEDAFTKREFS